MYGEKPRLELHLSTYITIRILAKVSDTRAESIREQHIEYTAFKRHRM